MDFLSDIFQYRFLTNALAACLLSGVVCGVVGTYVVCRRTVFLSGGITHASLGGIGIAYYMGLSPILGAAVFAVLSALGIEVASARGRVREDSAIGIVWSVGMAVGVIFMYLTPGYAPNLMSFLFGNILTVTTADIACLGALAVVVIPLFALFGRQIVYVAFDRQYARSQGVPAGLVSGVMSVVVALAIVFSIRTVGIVLLMSLLTIPAVIANSLTHSFGRMCILSALFAAAGSFAGLWLSYALNVPAGAAAVFTLAFVLAAVKITQLLARPRNSN